MGINQENSKQVNSKHRRKRNKKKQIKQVLSDCDLDDSSNLINSEELQVEQKKAKRRKNKKPITRSNEEVLCETKDSTFEVKKTFNSRKNKAKACKEKISKDSNSKKTLESEFFDFEDFIESSTDKVAEKSKKSKKQNRKSKKGSSVKEVQESSSNSTRTGKHSGNSGKQSKVLVKKSTGSIEISISEKSQVVEEKFNGSDIDVNFVKLTKSKRRRNRKKRLLASANLTEKSVTTSHKRRKRNIKTPLNSNKEGEESKPSNESAPIEQSGELSVSNVQQNEISDKLDSVFKKLSIISPTLEEGSISSPECSEAENSLGSYIPYESFPLGKETLHFLKDSCEINDTGETHWKDSSSVAVETTFEESAQLSDVEDCDKFSVPNFLSHDNIEGLFRSALLNDATLSSRCSEKEVKNFFNTYGTFSEKNRTQFAEVEKLLLSSSNLEDTIESSLFDGENPVTGSGLKKSTSVSNTVNSLEDSEVLSNSESIRRKVLEDQSHNSTSAGTYLSNPISGLNSSEIGDLNKVGASESIYANPNPTKTVISGIYSPPNQRECGIHLPPSIYSSTSSKQEKSESLLFEIVGNVLLVHERVQEQLACGKKLPSHKYSSSGTESALPDSSGVDDISRKSFNLNKNSTNVNSSVDSQVECKSSTQERELHDIVDVDEILVGCESVLSNLVRVDNSLKTESSSVSCKMQKVEKTREEIQAEREAKKLAKMARKSKAAGSQAVSSAGDSGFVKESPVPTKAQNNSSSDPVSSIPDNVPKTMKKETSSTNSVLSASIADVKNTVTEIDGEIPKSKAQLRAERRAKQEAQRSAKTAQQQPQQPQKQQKQTVPLKQQAQKTSDPIKLAAQTEKKVESSSDLSVRPTAGKQSKPELGRELIKPLVLHKVKLFNHLYLKQEASVPKSISATSHLHPAVVRLGVQYATKIVVGSNARCLALLSAVKQVIEDYKTPPQKDFSRGLEEILQPSIAFLQQCRPSSVSMKNAVKHIKWQMRHLPNNVSDLEAKQKLQEAIDTYIREQIDVAGQAICNTVIDKISVDDVILTYGCSSLLQRILIKAHKSGKQFRVVIVDARPWREGREMLRRLVENGLHCSYVVISAASFIMREATKVLLGAHALLANGYVMSRAGSSQVALLAHSYNVPVLVCCETHKFSERVQTDSIVYNELGNPEELVTADSCSKEQPLAKWKTINHLTPLNITYDVTPPDLVTAVVTELAILPCTSVPVVLRIKPTEVGF